MTTHTLGLRIRFLPEWRELREVPQLRKEVAASGRVVRWVEELVRLQVPLGVVGAAPASLHLLSGALRELSEILLQVPIERQELKVLVRRRVLEAEHYLHCRRFHQAGAESFFATLKIEFVRQRTWPTRRELIGEVFDCMEAFYKPTRRHSTLGYLSPAQFEIRASRSDTETMIIEENTTNQPCPSKRGTPRFRRSAWELTRMLRSRLATLWGLPLDEQRNRCEYHGEEHRPHTPVSIDRGS